MRDLRQDSLPDDVSWDDMMIYMRQFMTQLMGASGKLEIDLITGALVASDRGGFIHDFITRDHEESSAYAE